MNNNPIDTTKTIINKLSIIESLSGYYEIDYYTGDCTVHGITFPEGTCYCSRHNQYEIVYCDLMWEDFSEYTQRLILMEIADKYSTNT